MNQRFRVKKIMITDKITDLGSAPYPSVYVVELKTRKMSMLSKDNVFAYNTVLCLGNFDGVHKGHTALMNKTVSVAKELSDELPNTVSGAWFFSHPTREYEEGPACREITLIEEKLDIMQKLGIEYAFIADFCKLKNMTAFEYICSILENICHCKAVVCGYNFRFGRSGLGDAKMLAEHFSEKTFVIDRICEDGIPVSSSLIRKHIECGEIEKANNLLGHPFSLSSCVVTGKKFGRTIGFPTANQVFPDGKIIPRHGVYATLVRIEGIEGVFTGVSNVGSNPTVNDSGNITCETYILDLDQNIYGKRMEVGFYKLLRLEKKFDSIESLRSAISENADEARDYFHDTKV